MRKFKKILVTGGCGFIGWNFIRYVMGVEKFQIINIDKLTYASKKNLIGSKNSKRYKFYKNISQNNIIFRSFFSVFFIFLIFAMYFHIFCCPDLFNMLSIFNPFIIIEI